MHGPEPVSDAAEGFVEGHVDVVVLVPRRVPRAMQAAARDDEVPARRLHCRQLLADDEVGTSPGVKARREVLAVTVEQRRLALGRGVQHRSQAVGIDDEGEGDEPPSQGDRLALGQPKMPGIH